MTPLPKGFVDTPLTHRALHDIADGRPENSRAAIRAAIARGYGIEIDLQLSADDQAMVFHDYHLKRLTGATGLVRQRSAHDLSQIALQGGDGETIPTLSEVLDLVAGRVPLLIEAKDQDGAMGPAVGPLEQAATDALTGYDGPVALMSFNPHSVAEFAKHAPSIARGLTTCNFNVTDWPLLPMAVRKRLRQIPDFDRCQASFVSHDLNDLGNPRLSDIRAARAAILCWTVKSPAQEGKARQVADNITFERYLAQKPAA